MKTTISSLSLTTVALAASGAHAATTPRLASRDIAGANVQYVVVDLKKPGLRIQPVLARGGVGSQESLGDMARRTESTVAVTGAFFDTRTLKPMGDIVIGGELIHYGGRGAALCIQNGKKGLVAAIRSNAGCDRHTDWGESKMVLAGGLWLVRDNEIAVNPRAQGFSPLLQQHADPRVGVGITEDGRLILAATKTPVSLTQWARALRSLGAVNALNYDGGSSTGLFVGGKSVIAPGRKLTNALAVFIDSDAQASFSPHDTVARVGRPIRIDPVRFIEPVRLASRGRSKRPARRT